jgi:Leucine-rich repeat (LRR) protein
VLNCNNNQIKSLPKDLPKSLQWLNCSENRLTLLPQNLPSSLKYLDCSSNEIFLFPKNLPNSLEALDCNDNNMMSLSENLPFSLKELRCRGNKLLSLPIGLINLEQLTYIDFSDNPIEYIHSVLSRFLNIAMDAQRSCVIKNMKKQVYNDTQSVHNGSVQASIRQSIINILSTRLDW